MFAHLSAVRHFADYFRSGVYNRACEEAPVTERRPKPEPHCSAQQREPQFERFRTKSAW